MDSPLEETIGQFVARELIRFEKKALAEDPDFFSHSFNLEILLRVTDDLFLTFQGRERALAGIMLSTPKVH